VFSEAQSKALTRRIARFVASAVGRAGRDERHLLNELRRTRHARGFALFFALTVLLPTLLLASLAFSSIGGEELAVDNELARRGATIAEVVLREVGSHFDSFERGATERLHSGGSMLTRQSELSPMLRAVFVFDSAGNLIEPFAMSEPERAVTPSAAADRLRREALQAEGAGHYSEALAAWSELALSTNNAVEQADATIGRARCYIARGDRARADNLLASLRTSNPTLRDEHGFRVAYVARLLTAEMKAPSDAADAEAELHALVSDVLAERWPLGQFGEPGIALRALADVERLAPNAAWLPAATQALDEHSARLAWASPLSLEISLIGRSARSGLSPGFHYESRPDSVAAWATLRHDDLTYAFAFDQHAIEMLFERIARTRSETEGDLHVVIERLGRSNGAQPLATRQLEPWLTSHTIAVVAADSRRLVALKRAGRIRRLFVIGLALFATLLGATLMTRLVATELAHATVQADFAASVSHELRSPITQIRMKAESLSLGLAYDEADAQEHYDLILREAERLSRLVDNILDFAAIERGAKTYLMRPGDLGEIIETQLAAAREVLRAAGLEVQRDLPDDLPAVWIDREAIGQVVTNLISNASKYGADGGWLRVTAGHTPTHVWFAVSDGGRGIAPEDLRKIFDPFFRSNDPVVRRQKGTGIGLNIVRYIVEAHGGTIRATSTLGDGTTFTVHLPLSPPKRADGA